MQAVVIMWSNYHIQHCNDSSIPDSKVHGTNMGPIWGRQDPGGPHVGPVNFAIWDYLNQSVISQTIHPISQHHWWAMGCLLWGFQGKFTTLYQRCTVQQVVTSTLSSPSVLSSICIGISVPWSSCYQTYGSQYHNKPLQVLLNELLESWYCGW